MILNGQISVYKQSINMVFLPRYLIHADAFEELHYILAAVVVGSAVVIPAHQYDGHIREEMGKLVAGLHQPLGVHRHGLLDGNDREGHALLDDDGAMYGHRKNPPFTDALEIILSK